MVLSYAIKIYHHFKVNSTFASLSISTHVEEKDFHVKATHVYFYFFTSPNVFMFSSFYGILNEPTSFDPWWRTKQNKKQGNIGTEQFAHFVHMSLSTSTCKLNDVKFTAFLILCFLSKLLLSFFLFLIKLFLNGSSQAPIKVRFE